MGFLYLMCIVRCFVSRARCTLPSGACDYRGQCHWFQTTSHGQAVPIALIEKTWIEWRISIHASQSNRASLLAFRLFAMNRIAVFPCSPWQFSGIEVRSNCEAVRCNIDALIQLSFRFNGQLSICLQWRHIQSPRIRTFELSETRILAVSTIIELEGFIFRSKIDGHRAHPNRPSK